MTTEINRSGYLKNGNPVFIIALKNGKNQVPSLTRYKVFNALLKGIEIEQGPVEYGITNQKR